MKVLTDDYMNELMYLYFNIVVCICMYISLCRSVSVLVLIYTNIIMNMVIDMRRNITVNINQYSVFIKHIRIRLYKRVILILMLVRLVLA